MKIFLILSISCALFLRLSASVTPTLPVEQHIKRLKEQLQFEIDKASRKKFSFRKFPPISDEYEYDEEGFKTKDFVIYPFTNKKYIHRELYPIRTGHASRNRSIKKRRKPTTVKDHIHKSMSVLREELKPQKTSIIGVYIINPLHKFFQRALELFADDSDRK